MDPVLPDGITRLLIRWREGDENALQTLIPLVYDELRRIARRYLKQERRGHTLQCTDLVNEAYIRLIDARSLDWQNRTHFFGIAARLMRRILVDYSRNRTTVKRGSETLTISLNEASTAAGQRDLDLVSLDDALTGLEKLDPRQGRMVELRFFGGLSIEETSEVLGVSPATVKREWTTARAWLHREMRTSR